MINNPVKVMLSIKKLFDFTPKELIQTASYNIFDYSFVFAYFMIFYQNFLKINNLLESIFLLIKIINFLNCP